jgi:heme exporter protein B
MAPGVILCADAGLAALGSLLGALAQGQAARESVLSILVFPLLLPLLLAAVRMNAVLFGADNAARQWEEFFVWLKLALAFDCLFAAAGLLLFSFVYRHQE